MEWWYLNPAVPYFFTALENDEERLEEDIDNDNSILFIFGRYKIRPNISTYFELIIDEFQTKKESIDTYPNSLGFKIGIDGSYKVLANDIFFNIEYNKLDNWTYIHGGLFTNWQNRDHSIGYPFGSDLRSSEIELETWISKKILLSFNGLYLNKGNNSLSTYWQAKNSVELLFPSEPVLNYNIMDFSVSFYNTLGMIKIGISNQIFPNIIAISNKNNHDREMSFYFEFQVVNDFSFKI